MALLRLCPDDPLLRVLRDVFRANIVRIPDSRVQPLSVVAQVAGSCFFRGELTPLLEAGPPLDIRVSASLIADIAGRRSRHVTLDLGLHLLRGFLAGLGVPSAGLGTALEEVSSIAFAFPEATRSAIDINALGNALSGHRLRRDNPASAVFFEQAGELLLIDSVLSSSTIALHLRGGSDCQLSLDVAGLERLVTGTGVSVAASDTPEANLSFTSIRRLTFAFTCVRLVFDNEGRISALSPDNVARTLGSETQWPTAPQSPERVLLSASPGLIVWDSESKI